MNIDDLIFLVIVVGGLIRWLLGRFARRGTAVTREPESRPPPPPAGRPQPAAGSAAGARSERRAEPRSEPPPPPRASPPSRPAAGDLPPWLGELLERVEGGPTPSEHRRGEGWTERSAGEVEPPPGERAPTPSEHRPAAGERAPTPSEHRPTPGEHRPTVTEHRPGYLAVGRRRPRRRRRRGGGSALVRDVLGDLRGAGALQRAWVLREVLGPPVALRDDDPGSG